MKHEKDKAIVYIITHLALGGAQKVCLALFNGLKEQGLPTYLITGKEGEFDHSTGTFSQYSYHRFFVPCYTFEIALA